MTIDRARGADIGSLDHLHRERREALKMPGEFVLHSLRHPYGTRLEEAAAEAFTMRRRMGQSSGTVRQRVVHPTPEALERAVERLEGLNQRATKSLPDSPKLELPAPISAPVLEALPVSNGWAVSSIGRATDS